MSKFLKGTFILLIAGLITRVLGFINRIVIARSIGEEGVGLYMMAFPTFILVVTLTQMGLPVAISKNIAEAEAKGNYAEIKNSRCFTSRYHLAFTNIHTCSDLPDTDSFNNVIYRRKSVLSINGHCPRCSDHCHFIRFTGLLSGQAKHASFCFLTNYRATCKDNFNCSDD